MKIKELLFRNEGPKELEVLVVSKIIRVEISVTESISNIGAVARGCDI